LGDEGVKASTLKACLEGTCASGKIRRGGFALYIGVAACVNGNTEAKVVAAPAKVGRVGKAGAVSVELRYEGIGLSAGVSRARRPSGDGKLRRGRGSRDVCIVVAVEGDRASGVGAKPAEVRRIQERRVDYERAPVVVGRDA